MDMQLRYDTQLTVEAYINTKAWKKATLSVCPNHPNGGCALARHGTYARKCGRGRIAHIARWYCADSHTTFSLLPDCFAARQPGSLKQLEQIAVAIEQGQEPLEVMQRVRANADFVDPAARPSCCRCGRQSMRAGCCRKPRRPLNNEIIKR